MLAFIREEGVSEAGLPPGIFHFVGSYGFWEWLTATAGEKYPLPCRGKAAL